MTDGRDLPLRLSDELLDEVRLVDWEDLGAVEAASGVLLEAIVSEAGLLNALADHVLQAPRLMALSEHYDILDKLVLHDDESGLRVRLHIFRPGYFDRPHNHRWTYSSRILSGSYRHTLFGTDEGFGESIDVGALKARLVRTERAGSTYTLHHTMVHSTVAEPFTTSLIIRGPAVKERFLVTDRATNRVWWQYGAAGESAATASTKRMTRPQLEECVRRVHELNPLGGLSSRAESLDVGHLFGPRC